MSRHLKILLAVFLALFLAAPALAANFEFHGDLNNRFLVYTDQINFFESDPSNAELADDDAPDSFASIKYRLWTEASTNDGKVKGVYAIELGAIRFGIPGVGRHQGGSFSGDGANVETRWAYTDFQLPAVDTKARFRIGLQTHAVNPLFWAETAMGVKFYTDNFYIAWMRPKDRQNEGGGDWHDGDLDALTARFDLKADPVNVGLFANYFWQDVSSADTPALLTAPPFVNAYGVDTLPNMNFDMWAVGIDGKWSVPTGFGKVFVNWDAIYENGSFDDVSFDNVTTQSLDLSAYMLHADVGVNFGKATLTYSVYYASGDDNPTDGDLDGYIEVDTDASYSIIFNEGGYTDDDYFTDRYTIFDKGIFSHKLALDFQASKQTKFGIAALYFMLPEDLVLANGSTEDTLGTEIDAYVSHKLYDNLEVALNAGYLIADDAMDFFEVGPGAGNGSSDVDVWRSTARVRYSF